VLVGATEEAAGFDKRNTPRGVQNLTTLARNLVPQLADATFERAWAGLRPLGLDTLPYIDWAGEHRNVLVATGHFRSGLQLSPITAVMGTALLLGETPPVDPAPLRLDRPPHDAVPLHGVASEPLFNESATQGRVA
jgi:glycine oxidase